MRDEKRESPRSGVTISVETFLILWITQLQIEITHQETDANEAKFMVRGYDEGNAVDGTENDFTEIDLYADDPTNLTDGTWRDPQIWRDEEEGCVAVGEPTQSRSTPLQLDPIDACLIIENVGGKVTKFYVDGEEHYEVSIDGKIYGPLIETELYWFAYGVKLWPVGNESKEAAQ